MSVNEEISRWENYHKNYKPTIVGRFFKNEYEKLLDEVVKKLPLSPSARILDVGCGSGYFLSFFRERGFSKSIGIDLSKEGLKNCYRDYGFELGKDVFLMDATKTTFPSRSFDLIFSEGILEHFMDFESCICEMCRISRDIILLIQPNYSSVVRWIAKILWELFYSQREGIREYTYKLSEFETCFNDYDFDLKKNYLTRFRENAIMEFERK